LALNISVTTASIEIVFIVKIFQKYVLLGQQKSRVNFEWCVPLSLESSHHSVQIIAV